MPKWKELKMEIIEAIKIIYQDADTLFARIRDDLDRGLVEEARRKLNWVDSLLAGVSK